MADSTMAYNLQQWKEKLDHFDMVMHQLELTAQQNLAQLADLRRQLDLIAQAEGVDLHQDQTQQAVSLRQAGLASATAPQGPAAAPWQSPQAGQAGARGTEEPPHPQPLGSSRREDNPPPVVEDTDKPAVAAPAPAQPKRASPEKK